MKKDLILIGGGGHCKSCIDVIELQNQYNILGIIDVKEKFGQRILGYPIIASDEQLEEIGRKYKHFLITIGQIDCPQKRITLYQTIKNLQLELVTIISPLSHVSKYAKVGEGTIIMHGAIINASAEVGNNCIINTKALVEHDAKIEDHCHISTGAIVNGNVKISRGSFLGSNAVCKHSITIEEYSFIKANSIVKG